MSGLSYITYSLWGLSYIIYPVVSYITYSLWGLSYIIYPVVSYITYSLSGLSYIIYPGLSYITYRGLSYITYEACPILLMRHVLYYLWGLSYITYGACPILFIEKTRCTHQARRFHRYGMVPYHYPEFCNNVNKRRNCLDRYGKVWYHTLAST